MKQRIAVYESFLHAINTAQVAMNGERMMSLIGAADRWSYAHRQGNGELTQREQNKLINAAFKDIAKLVHVNLDWLNKIDA